jgi:hypothetical protein
MSKTLTIRNIDEPAWHRFVQVARKNHRNAEAHARFLVEREAGQLPAETGEDLLAAYAQMPPPEVDVAEIERFQAGRGRRSNRP